MEDRPALAILAIMQGRGIALQTRQHPVKRTPHLVCFVTYSRFAGLTHPTWAHYTTCSRAHFLE